MAKNIPFPKRRAPGRLVLATLALLGVFGVSPSLAAVAGRPAPYAAYRAAHPRLDAEIATLKARTAAAAAAAGPMSAAVADLPTIWRVPAAPTEIWDAPYAPEMVLIPAGEYTRGASAEDPARQPGESPAHRVRIGYAFAVSRYPVTVGEFGRFVAETHHAVSGGCWTVEGDVRANRKGRSWRVPGFPQSERSPVVCIGQTDADAYARWLAKKTGRAYRLLSDAEYEYVSRAGTTSTYWWGNAVGQGHSNCVGCGSRWDGKSSSPVGSFPPNPFGLYDVSGNVWSWLGDCMTTASYEGASRDGSALPTTGCKTPGLRGGSWDMAPAFVRSATRAGYESGNHFSIGFRVARDL